MLFQNNDIQARPNNPFQHKDLETLETPTSVNTDLKELWNFFPVKSGLLWGKLSFFSPSFLSSAPHPSDIRNVISWRKLLYAILHKSFSYLHWKLHDCRNSKDVKEFLNTEYIINCFHIEAGRMLFLWLFGGIFPSF